MATPTKFPERSFEQLSPEEEDNMAEQGIPWLDFYVKQMAPNLSQIYPQPCLYLGNISSIIDVPTVKRNNITAGLSLMGHRITIYSKPEFESINHKFIKCSDNACTNLLKEMKSACDWIDLQLETTSGAIVVHCVMGISRSATIVIAYLMRKFGYSVYIALAKVQCSRGIINPNNNFLRQLRIWGALKYEIWEDEEEKVPKKAYAKFLKDMEDAAVYDMMKNHFQEMVRKNHKEGEVFELTPDEYAELSKEVQQIMRKGTMDDKAQKAAKEAGAARCARMKTAEQTKDTK